MKQNIAFLVLAVIILGGATYLLKHYSPANQSAETSGTSQTNTNQNNNMDQLKIEDLTVGTGVEAKAGDVVTVNYTGTLDDGTVFDSSYKHNQPFTFLLGAGSVIQGWDQGVVGMKVGGKRRLTIPGSLAYGANGIPGVIPPNATLHFDIELMTVKSGQ